MLEPAPIPSHRRGPYRNGIRRRSEIIESATKIFGQHGFMAGTLRQIADEVGVSPAALARHFATKEDLLMAVLTESDARNVAEFSDAGGLEGLDNLVHLVEKNTQHRGLVELLLTVATEASSDSHPARPHMTLRYARSVDQVAGNLREARDRREIRPLTDAEIRLEARGFVALMDGLELQWLLDPDFDLIGAWQYHYTGHRQRWTSGL